MNLLYSAERKHTHADAHTSGVIHRICTWYIGTKVLEAANRHHIIPAVARRTQSKVHPLCGQTQPQDASRHLLMDFQDTQYTCIYIYI